MRNEAEFSRVLRFGFVGMAATAIHSVTYLALVTLSPVTPALANVIAYLVALSLSLLGHTRVTFGVELTYFRARRIVLTSLFALALNAAFVWLVAWLQYPSEYAVIFFITVTPAVTYLILKASLAKA